MLMMFSLLSLFCPFVVLAAFSLAQHVLLSETNKGSVTVTEVSLKRARRPGDWFMMALFCSCAVFISSQLYEYSVNQGRKLKVAMEGVVRREDEVRIAHSGRVEWRWIERRWDIDIVNNGPTRIAWDQIVTPLVQGIFLLTYLLKCFITFIFNDLCRKITNSVFTNFTPDICPDHHEATLCSDCLAINVINIYC